MKRHILVLAGILALGFAGPGAARAAAADPTAADVDLSCLDEAREALQSCRAECVNDFRNERFVCRHVEPGCGRECLGRRESCIETATEPLVSCLSGCRDTLVQAKAACATTCNGDTACLDACIDAAQVDAFTCRDNCREAFRMGAGLVEIAACRANFRECVRSCPPAP